MSEVVETEGASFFSQAKNFVPEALAELKKVSSPTRQEAMQATIVTIFIIGFMSICLFLLDLVFHKGMEALIGQ